MNNLYESEKGAQISKTPGAPTNLTEDSKLKSDRTLEIIWSAPNFTGADSIIIDYRVLIAK